MIITVSHLMKRYRVREQESGLVGGIRGVFRPRYRDVVALEDVSFEIDHGEFVGFLGPNGAGKTTTIKCLTGLLTPTSGDVEVLGYKPWERRYAFRRRFALVLGQKGSLWWDIPASEGFLLQKEIYGVPDARFGAIVGELAELLDVSKLLTTPIRQLSLGERMKMELIAGLLSQPELLFLDEPTIGLDLISQQRIREFLRQHNARYKTTIILTSHYIEDIRTLCPRIVVLGSGSVAYDGPLQELVSRHAPERRLLVTFREPVVYEDLLRFGRVLSIGDGPSPVAQIVVPQGAVAEISAFLLRALPVVDLAISEVPVEEALRQLYEGKVPG